MKKDKSNSYVAVIKLAEGIAYVNTLSNEELKGIESFEREYGCHAMVDVYKNKLEAYSVVAHYMGKEVETDLSEGDCALTKFMRGITRIYHHNDVICGICRGVPFYCEGTTEFKWGSTSAKKHKSNHKVALLPTPVNKNTGKMTNSRVSIETLYYFLIELWLNGETKDSYLGICANCMGNEAAMGKEINPKWLEQTTHRQNLAVSKYWHWCKNAGVNVVLSATNYRFREYLEECPGKITKKYIRDYPGVWSEPEIWNKEEYWVVNNCPEFELDDLQS